MAANILSCIRSFLRPLVMDYGMVLVLVLLVVAMSVLTLKDQQLTGREAGLSVADELISRFDADAGIIICIPGSTDDRAFAEAVQERLATGARRPLAVVSGSPAEARQLIERLTAEGTLIDAIAVTGDVG